MPLSEIITSHLIPRAGRQNSRLARPSYEASVEVEDHLKIDVITDKAFTKAE
jgi:hypothetical protein